MQNITHTFVVLFSLFLVNCAKKHSQFEFRPDLSESMALGPNYFTQLAANFEKVGGNPMAFQQLTCFFERYKKNKFIGQNKNELQIRNQKFLTITDLTKPSDTPRLFVLNLETFEVRAYLVAHGSGVKGAAVTLFETDKIGQSDLQRILFPEILSNTPGSYATSRGIFILDEVYNGSFGYSLRQHGLQKDVNENVLKRIVVMHGFKGIDPTVYSSTDLEFPMVHPKNLALSQGCSMLEPSRAKEVIDQVKGGSLYYVFSEQEKSKGPNYCADENLLLSK